MRIQIAPTVYSDVLEIMEYFDREAGPDLAAQFYAEFRSMARAAGERPFSFPESGRFRRANLHHFPHHFLFEIIEERIVRILIVRHDRRHPDFGLHQ